jgi:hypothetical protein
LSGEYIVSVDSLAKIDEAVHPSISNKMIQIMAELIVLPCLVFSHLLCSGEDGWSCHEEKGAERRRITLRFSMATLII